ncbi:alkyl hydroperoxide reductase [Glaciecola punicea ACAM 611]|jgi:peroxiredoxin|uniref:Alkyl hydroperoxide reductase n=1 Tax=Glaciecola punicea ACAM 611 TaxID=1121923 RepID=H5T7N3_9ALTE|nr:peroxiredoxin family protein [Glaciecola punicea]GAB54310.1 alkyl hydroperoxide reductase [Glaciecola punicea ACAM 611]
MISFKPGDTFPDVQVKTKDSEETSLIPRLNEISGQTNDSDWYAIFVYRGKHCPICAKYLNMLQDKLDAFKKINLNIIAVSADSIEQLNAFYTDHISDVEYPVFAGLTVDVMQNMGLYLSKPLSGKETDHIFPEPALFVVNPKREIQIVEKSNAPFTRPEIDQLLSGIEFSQKNDYPIRGDFTV